MKKIIYALSALAMLTVTACSTTTVVCTVEGDLNAGIAAQLVTLAACKNPAGIVADLQGVEADLKLCPASDKDKGLLQDACALLLPAIVNLANSNHILQDGQCDLSKGTVDSLLATACNALPASAKKIKVLKK